MGQAGVGFKHLVQFLALGALHLDLQAADPLFHVKDSPLDFQKLAVNGLMAGKVLVLGQIAHGLAPGQGHETLVRGKLSHNDL